MKQLFANNIETTLAALLSSSATSATVTSAAGMPDPGTDEYFLLTLCTRTGNVESAFEIVKVTARTGAALTIERAQEGTTGVEHASGSVASARLTAAAIERPQFETVAKTANYTLTAEDCNGFKTFLNKGAAGDINLTLPVGFSGAKVKMLLVNGNNIHVYAHSGEIITFDGLYYSADDYPAEAYTGGSWYSTSGATTYNYDDFIELKGNIDSNSNTYVEFIWDGDTWRCGMIFYTGSASDIRLGFTEVPD